MLVQRLCSDCTTLLLTLNALFWPQSYEHLFKTNAPPAPKGQPGGGAGSFYLQSKIVRARERIEAEWEGAKKKESGEADAAATGAAESSGESPGPGQGR